MAYVSNERKREILDSAKGQMFHVTFVKADGTIRTLQAKKWIGAAFASGTKDVVQKSNAPDNNYVLVDMKEYRINPKRSIRSLKLENLLECKVSGKEHDFRY